MHRHGYQGRKLGRKRDQRRALLKSLADSLVLYESIETTFSKAKEVSPYVEKIITKQLPPILDYIESQVPAMGFLFGE